MKKLITVYLRFTMSTLSQLSDHLYANNNASNVHTKLSQNQEPIEELFKPPPPGQKQMSRIYKGYAYTINCKTSTRTYLCCLKRKAGQYNCKGRLVVVNGRIIQTGEHNHPPDENLIKKKKFNDLLRHAAKQNIGNFRDIYDKYSKEYPEAVKGISFSSLARKYRRWVNQENSDPIQNNNNDVSRQKAPILSEIEDVDHFLTELDNDFNAFTYGESTSQKNLLQHNIIESSHHKNKHLLIYDKFIMDKVCDARKIIIHKVIPTFSKKSKLSVITIIFEKYEKALAGLWILIKGEEQQCYTQIIEYIKFLFPYFNPKEAVVDYNKNMQAGLKIAFPKLIFIPSFLNQTQIIFESALKQKAAKLMNRVVNSEKHSELLKFIALPLLPKDKISSNYNRLVSESKTKYPLYFDLFIDNYFIEWIEGWKPETFSVYRQKHLLKNFLECFRYRQYFKNGKKLQPLSFLEKIKNTLTIVRKDLELLERGDILNYHLTPADEEKEKKLYRTWDRLDDDLITDYECLMICSNLLSEDFIDSLLERRYQYNENEMIAPNDDQAKNNIQELPKVDLFLETNNFDIGSFDSEIEIVAEF